MYHIYSKQHSFNADCHTPVGLYLNLRNQFRSTCLLESNDYHDRSDSKSFIGLEPIVEIKIQDRIEVIFKQNRSRSYFIAIDNSIGIEHQIQAILNNFSFDQQSAINGFFGRMGFELSSIDKLKIQHKQSGIDIPHFQFFIYNYVLVIDHFKDQGILIKNECDEEVEITQEEIKRILQPRQNQTLPFEKIGEEKAQFSDSEFQHLVEKGIEHCKRGDVFQLVLSNQFHQPYFGDDFALYRSLRRLNPSPYLFYFDFEDYHLLGSSPEAQLIVRNNEAEIHPIAGTVVKSANQEANDAALTFLKNDAKENAEHTMLVDLARNDLSKHSNHVKIKSYKEIQTFSHVFHIVSKVVGSFENNPGFPLIYDTFPAGTLSGTPKPKALELIAKYEKQPRTFYGGAIGLLASNGESNLAIVIRSVLSKNNVLHYQAGAGIVLHSVPENECKEVHNKLRAVRTAIQNAALVQSNSIAL